MELTGHVNEDLLIAYFCGDLGEERARKIETHVENCTACAKDFKIYKTLFSGFLGILATPEQKPAPEQLRQALRENLKKNRIHYSILQLPTFVPIAIARTFRGVVNIVMGNFSRFEFEERLKKNFPRLWLAESYDETAQERAQFEAYFRCERTDFDFALDERLIKSGFQKQVLTAIRDIPYGHVITYGELARRINNPRATRAAGRALGANPLPIVLPCHRVVAGQGKLGGFTGGAELKLKLLQLEGARYPHSTNQMDLFNPFN